MECVQIDGISTRLPIQLTLVNTTDVNCANCPPLSKYLECLDATGSGT